MRLSSKCLSGIGLLASALLLIGCAGPRAGGVHYSPPSAAPVRDKISSAQGHAKAAKAALSSIPNSEFRIPNSAVALQTANQEIDALLDELVSTQSALKDYESKVFSQTQAANRAMDEKNQAITERDKETAKAKRIAKREHFFFLLLSGALIWIFRVPLLALLKLLAALITKIPI